MNNPIFIILFLIFAFLALILESTVINFPVVFFICALLLAFVKKMYIYAFVFILAFMIDSLRVNNFGYTSLFLLATIALILLYERYSGSKDIIVIGILIACVGFIYSHFMLYSIVNTLILYGVIILFLLAFNLFRKKFPAI